MPDRPPFFLSFSFSLIKEALYAIAWRGEREMIYTYTLVCERKTEKRKRTKEEEKEGKDPVQKIILS
jgi:hypothetical protein